MDHIRCYLSVNQEGVLSLWDTPQTRQRGAADEAWVDLLLTDAQEAVMRMAYGRRYGQPMPTAREEE